MTAFMLACYLNGVAQGQIYFRNVADCTFYTEYLSEQTYDSPIGDKVTYECICKLVPRVNPKKVKVY
tara:strand:- start:375 stop:575 length:201 start_codon:yes stop_codon:yes gene_type:complete